MTKMCSTREAALLLKVKASRLQQAIWRGQLRQPSRSPAGDWLWTARDIQRAEKLLARKASRVQAAS